MSDRYYIVDEFEVASECETDGDIIGKIKVSVFCESKHTCLLCKPVEDKFDKIELLQLELIKFEWMKAPAGDEDPTGPNVVKSKELGLSSVGLLIPN